MPRARPSSAAFARVTPPVDAGAAAVDAAGNVYAAVTRTTAQGVTSRVATLATANGVAVAPDGTVYVNQWESKRVGRLDPRSGMVEPVARG